MKVVYEREESHENCEEGSQRRMANGSCGGGGNEKEHEVDGCSGSVAESDSVVGSE